MPRPGMRGLGLREHRTSRQSRLLFAAFGAGVAARGLATDGEFSAVSITTPGADVLQPFDVKGNLPAEFSFGEFLLHPRAEPRLVGLVQRIGLRVHVHVDLPQDSAAERPSDAFDRREGDLDALIAR